MPVSPRWGGHWRSSGPEQCKFSASCHHLCDARQSCLARHSAEYCSGRHIYWRRLTGGETGSGRTDAAASERDILDLCSHQELAERWVSDGTASATLYHHWPSAQPISVELRSLQTVLCAVCLDEAATTKSHASIATVCLKQYPILFCWAAGYKPTWKCSIPCTYITDQLLSYTFNERYLPQATGSVKLWLVRILWFQQWAVYLAHITCSVKLCLVYFMCRHPSSRLPMSRINHTNHYV